MTKTMTLRSKSTLCGKCRTRLRNAGKRQRRIQGLEGVIVVSFTAWYCNKCGTLAPTAPGIAINKYRYSDRVIAKVQGLLRHMSYMSASSVIYREHGFWIPVSTIGEWSV